MDKNLDQIKKVKLNLTNIHSILVTDNKNQKKIILRKEQLSVRQRSKKKLKNEEQKLESPIKSSLNKVKKSTGSSSGSSGGSIFDKILKFGGLLLTGIIVNALPAIIEKVKEIIDNIVNFLTPIQSGFNLIMAFFTGEMNDSKLDPDKKRFDDGLKNISGKGGLVDKIAEKMGPFGGLIKMLKPAINSVSSAISGEKMVLAKKDGKEGVLNRETGIFTEKQFTSAEREQYTRDPESESSRDKPSNSDGQYTGQIPPAGSNAKALLNTIRFAEGTSHDQGYNTWFGGRSDMDLTFMTINEVVNEQKKRLRNGEATYGRYTSAAVGAYQMMTPEVFARTAGFNPETTLFSPEVQDSMAIAGYMKGQARMSQAEIDAPINRRQIAKMAPVWASLPMMNGRSRYNQPVKSFDLLRQVYNKSLNNGGSTTGEGGSLNMFTQVIFPQNRKDERKMAAINQPMYEDLDDEEEMVNVYIQPINTTRTVYNYKPIPV